MTFNQGHVVYVHGYNPNQEDFDLVVWGDPATGRMGRLPMAAYVAKTANTLLFSTGAASREYPSHGVLIEAKYMQQYFLDNMARLPDEFPECFEVKDLEHLWQLGTSALIECLSRNTFTSAMEVALLLENFFNFETTPCMAPEYPRVTTVSSRNHERHVHHTAMILQHGCGSLKPLSCWRQLVVDAVFAHTGYNNDGSMASVAIQEDPGGEDRYAAAVDRWLVSGEIDTRGHSNLDRFVAGGLL